MTRVTAIAKGSEAAGHIASAIQKFVKADGDTWQLVSGVLDIFNALTAFLPPPASMIIGSITGIANMFIGGGSTDTTALIQNEFSQQTRLILEQFQKMKKVLKKKLEQQALDEMNILAEVRKLYTYICSSLISLIIQYNFTIF